MNKAEKPIKKSGQLQLIFGPMFSGKTSELIRRICRYQLCNHRCLFIRYAKDIRYSENCISTHDGKSCSAISTLLLQHVSNFIPEFDVIGIDEGQFFPDVYEFCKELLESSKIVVVAGLDATFQRKGFGKILSLVPLAHSVDKLSAICMSCGGKASFTKRTIEDKEVEVIGGIDKYMSVCRECYKIDFPTKSTPFKNMEIAECDVSRS